MSNNNNNNNKHLAWARSIVADAFRYAARYQSTPAQCLADDMSEGPVTADMVRALADAVDELADSDDRDALADAVARIRVATPDQVSQWEREMDYDSRD